MKLIGAGYSKTGTMSLKAALEKLGYRCYHMEDAIVNYEKGDLQMWNAYLEGQRDIDWHKLFAEYDAALELSAVCYRELMEAFPEARVILTVRDPEKWWESLLQTVEVHNARVGRSTFLPRFREFQRLFKNLERVVFGGFVREVAIERYKQHVEEVKATVPPDRLLVFDVKEGWEPLCHFLGVPVPDEPFPHENVGSKGVEKILMRVIVSDLIKMALPVVLIVAVVIIVLVYLLSR